MSYGLKYQTQFDSLPDANTASKRYTLQFLFKGYSGGVTSVICGETPITVSYGADKANEVIKGSSAQISLLNKNNALPLAAFNTVEDDDIQIKLLDINNAIIWVGYVVQEDSYEDMTDATHIISLSANDSLGMLKGVILSEPGNLNLLNRNTLLDIIKECMSATNLALPMNIFCNLTSYPQDVAQSHFSQTLIDAQTFISGETYEDCYTVLTKILTPFRCSIFQANGEWNIVHWDELKFYTGAAIPCYQYDSGFNYLGQGVFDNVFFIGADPQLSRPVYPLSKGSVQPYKFVRRTFNYVNPKYLIRNSDLKILGTLLRDYTTGGNRYREYSLPFWGDSGFPGAGTAETFIRVVNDSGGNELVRYIVARNGTYAATPVGVQSNSIEVTKGDILKISFSYSTDVSQPGNNSVGTLFALRHYNGTNNKFARNWQPPSGVGAPVVINPVWDNITSIPVTLPKFWYDMVGSNTNEWQTVEIYTAGVPSDGLAYLWLSIATQNAVNETRYKDFTCEVIATVNESLKITGHIHNNERAVNVKNNSDENIDIDDSPRNAFIGTLFLNSVTNLLQDRTSIWKYIYHPSGYYYRLYELMTHEDLTIRDQQRIKYEGEFIGLYQNNILSALTIVKTDFDTTKSFIFGMLNIDYKKNRFNGTLYEYYDNLEADLLADYTFTYKYSAT